MILWLTRALSPLTPRAYVERQLVEARIRLIEAEARAAYCNRLVAQLTVLAKLS
jgi:hypothetical protein